jgi:AAA15 family ATPase/GTPase
MHVSSLELKNFKRFTDLTIDLSKLAQPPKLVLLIGANGSGKSSVFDGFDSLLKYYRAANGLFQDSTVSSDPTAYYYKAKDKHITLTVKLDNDVVLAIGDEEHDTNIKHAEPASKTTFYGRSSLRQIPRLSRTSLGASSSFDLANDSDRPLTYVDRDERFENDLEEITRNILQEFYQSNRERSEIIKTYIDPINEALDRIFDDDKAVVPKLVSIIPPLDGKVAEVRFKKGGAEFRYDLLSNGEKGVFNILINLLSRKKHYQDTIYFIDELDLHLNTRLQYNLLKEITEHWIPDNCQLWTASHSYGFIDYAREAKHAAIIDFDSFDFDVKQVLLPEPKDSLDVFDVAIPKESIFKLFDNKQIVLCENQNDEFYNLLGLKDKLFVGVKNKNDVFLYVKRDPRYHGLIDRDYLTDKEVEKAQKKYPKLKMLRYYCFENYLYHPDNLSSLAPDFDKAIYVQEIVDQKNARKLKLISKIAKTRDSYTILRAEDEIRDDDFDPIIEALSSDNLETFYPFFSMKEFNKESIAGYNWKKEQLVTTPWFKQKIAEVLT